MKAITIHDPFASAIAFGIKQYETRPRKTNHRGLLAIHAGKTFNQHGLDSVDRTLWSDHIKLPLTRRYSGVSEKDFPKGAIVAVVELVDCILIDQDLIDSIGPHEASLGHWDIGRYAYKLENIQALKLPVPTKGFQGLWNVSEELEQLINEQL
jgi:hypothetical protein